MATTWGVVYERTATGWSGYVPALPGLGVTGTTRAEVEQLIREGGAELSRRLDDLEEYIAERSVGDPDLSARIDAALHRREHLRTLASGKTGELRKRRKTDPNPG